MVAARFADSIARAGAIIALVAACGGRSSERHLSQGDAGTPSAGTDSSSGGSGSPAGGASSGGSATGARGGTLDRGGTAGIAEGGSSAGGVVSRGGATARGGARATGGASTGGITEGGEGGTAGEACTPLENPVTTGDGCEELERLRVSRMHVENLGPDGILSVGETFYVVADLWDDSGYGFNAYPFIHFSVAPGGVGVSQSGPGAFALLPCESIADRAYFIPGETIGPGTEVIVTARAAALNQDCPNAPSAELRIVVQ